MQFFNLKHSRQLLRRRLGYALLVIAASFLVVTCARASSPEAIASGSTNTTSSDYPYVAPASASLTDPATTPIGHEAGEGFTLGTPPAETVYPGALCPLGAPVRKYDIVAINVEITLNRYLDYEPQGRMFVLEQDLEWVRKEEAQNRDARVGKAEPPVSLGEQSDVIQPLTLRINQGECLRVKLTNRLVNAEPASFHLHASGLHLAGSGAPAIATNPDALVAQGGSVMYEWMVGDDEPEGTHYFHSHGNERLQTNHGLFGAVIVEPKGSKYLDPLRGDELWAGWAAMIQPPTGNAFREFAIYYHEIGDEHYAHLDRNGRIVPLVDPYTESYKPGSRALNYRSEPFMNRLALQQQTIGKFDKSQSYSSYVFGDPATPILRSYLGDPVKERVIHGGAEVFHVHHVHGGATRWSRQPDAEPSNFDSGLDKHPPLFPQATERTDSQSIGPSETFDLQNECGSGGCQQSVGDYLYHCHVAQHYLSGMWSIWRVYNTLQDGKVSQDAMPPLEELPDRKGGVKPAVTSEELVGKQVAWYGKTFHITDDNLSDWVEQQLPPSGTPKGYDASVLDWKREGRVYRNETETSRAWAGYHSRNPGTRPPFYFDLVTGKLAYPFLRPHLAARPPFAPNHGPAPFLDPIHSGTDPPPPGANGPGSLCPSGTNLKSYVIEALALPLALNKTRNIVDPSGALYVLKNQEDLVKQNDQYQTPLAIRANAGEDCIDVTFKSQLPDTRESVFFSKVDIHIHFVQFDVQASDGVNTGFNYEQSVRPYTVEGETVAAPSTVGATRLRMSSTMRFQPGILVGVGMEQAKTFEVAKIKALDGEALVFDAPLRFAHAKDEIVSAEFVRYRWYPDVQFGTAYFHDHVDALHSWRHGLFGALIAEPPHSTYHDPHSGAVIESGTLADIHTDRQVSADVTGSFREMVMFVQDDNLLTNVGDSTGSSFNLRVEPLLPRRIDPVHLFSSTVHGDPATPLLESFLGDPIVIRTLVGGTNDVHTWHVDGHWFRQEAYSATSPPINTVHLGISERYDLVIPKAGGPQNLLGDYLYYNGREFKLKEGSWGILRVLDNATNALLKKLPGHETIPKPATSVCPGDAPLKKFSIAAIDAALPMLGTVRGKLYVLEADKAAVQAGTKPPEPLVLHVNVGDCLQMELTNETAQGSVSLQANMLAFDPKDSYGIAAGNDPDQSIKPGEARTYTYFASPEVGETTALVRDGGNVLDNPRLGLYGAIVVGPPGATYTDPLTGADASMASAWSVQVHPASGKSYRDFALFLQDEDTVIGTAIMPYTQQVRGVVGLNYRAEPFQKRLSQSNDPSKIFWSVLYGDPTTPLLEAFAGDPVRLHVMVPFGEQAHVFTVEGHEWQLEPGLAGTRVLSSIQLGGLEALTIRLDSAGGQAQLPGDYVYGDHREPYREAGLWGLFRVYPRGTGNTKLLPLSDH